MVKVGRIERHMVGDPEGKNTGNEHSTDETRVGVVRTRGGVEEKKEGNQIIGRRIQSSS